MEKLKQSMEKLGAAAKAVLLGLVLVAVGLLIIAKSFQLTESNCTSLLLKDVKPSEDDQLVFSTAFELTRSEELHGKYFALSTNNCLELMSKGAGRLRELSSKTQRRIADLGG